jgi:PilZ domain
MDQRQNCAYNETRDRFLGLEVVAGDFSTASLIDWMPILTPSSHAGIWMVPFRGIPATDARVPLDLVYLDESCHVLDTVEFFPKFRVSPSSPAAASVLALPTNSIVASQTQKGDQLLLCAAREMEWRLKQLSRTESIPSAFPTVQPSPAQSTNRHFEKPQRTSGPVLLEKQNFGAQEASPSLEPVQKEPPAQPTGKPITPPRSWLERWLFPEPQDPRRRSLRQPAPGLAAHFFTGGAPQAHEVRDISASGLYVVTAERWYPGTIIRMTLSKPGSSGQLIEHSITVQAKSVRWGNDGVGLEFVLEAPRKARRSQPSPMDEVDSNQFGEFLKRVSAGNP